MASKKPAPRRRGRTDGRRGAPDAPKRADAGARSADETGSHRHPAASDGALQNDSADEEGMTGEHMGPLLTVSRETRPTTLKMVRGPGAPRSFRIDDIRGEIIVGRSLDAQISIDAAELSRKHMVLKRDGARYSIHDLDSRHGVFLNGIQVYGAVLHDGDHVQVGSVVFLFVEGAP